MTGKGFVTCLGCKKLLEVTPSKPLRKEVLEKGWGRVTLQTKDFEESFFVCEKCFAKLRGWFE